MDSDQNPAVTAEDPEAKKDYARAIPRMLRMIGVAGVVLIPVAIWISGVHAAIGFAAGGVVSWINFRALVRGVEGLADRVVDKQSREKGGAIVGRFLVRYGLVALVAYVIFISSKQAFRGFLCGLCLPVAALMAEACIESYAAVRQR
jgi:hypothetical protein